MLRTAGQHPLLVRLDTGHKESSLLDQHRSSGHATDKLVTSITVQVSTVPALFCSCHLHSGAVARAIMKF